MTVSFDRMHVRCMRSWTAMGWSSAEAGDQHAAAPRPAEPAAVKLDDGSYLISGWMPAIEFAELRKIPLPVSRQYQIIAGRDWAWLGFAVCELMETDGRAYC
jgi:hypothetical protein